MQYIDSSTILVSAGNTVKILNIQTLQHTLLPGVSGTSIGAIAVRSLFFNLNIPPPFTLPTLSKISAGNADIRIL
jgi:hypothetical protein